MTDPQIGVAEFRGEGNPSQAPATRGLYRVRQVEYHSTPMLASTASCQGGRSQCDDTNQATAWLTAKTGRKRELMLLQRSCTDAEDFRCLIRKKRELTAAAEELHEQ